MDTKTSEAEEMPELREQVVGQERGSMKMNIPMFFDGEMVSHDPKNPTKATIKGVKWLDAEDLPFELEEGKKGCYQITLEIDDTPFAWTMSDTSLRTIGKKFGLESDNWIGKDIELYTLVQNVFGKERWVAKVL